MFNDFFHAFYYSSLFATFLLSLLFLKRLPGAYRWLAYLIILTVASEMVAKYMAFFVQPNNNAVYHFFTPLEFAVYCVIYAKLLNRHNWNIILAVAVLAIISFEILNTIFFQQLSETNTNSILLESVAVVFLSLALFVKIREQDYYENLLKEPVFWFNSAVLFYYSFNILIWGFHSIKVYQLKNPPQLMYDILLLFSGLLYFTYGFALILHIIFLKKNNNTDDLPNGN